jgi:2-polyprenyl-3-methyl-5-hydroxy-6-metoxy-1,4-benzoquinol methylase
MTWSFDQQVADIFAEHARQHIPDYDRVLDLAVDLCQQKLNNDAPILEIGCAVGETVNRLHRTGFTNIHAVDNSQAMLDRCPPKLATYYLSNTFPNVDIEFDAVLCNWTMHFVEDKSPYLIEIYQHLRPGSFLFLSEKTANSGLALEQYHLYKSRHGVSDQEIRDKAASLQGVMFPETIEWYLGTLKKLGFSQIAVANANWCFTTFVAIK